VLLWRFHFALQNWTKHSCRVSHCWWDWRSSQVLLAQCSRAYGCLVGQCWSEDLLPCIHFHGMILLQKIIKKGKHAGVHMQKLLDPIWGTFSREIISLYWRTQAKFNQQGKETIPFVCLCRFSPKLLYKWSWELQSSSTVELPQRMSTDGCGPFTKLQVTTGESTPPSQSGRACLESYSVLTCS